MNNFVQRTLSGAVYVGLVVASILVHPVFFGVLFGVISAWAVWEYHTLVGSGKALQLMSAIAGVMLFGITWACSHELGWASSLVLPLVCAYALWIMVVLVMQLFNKMANPIHSWGHLLISQSMIALPFAIMNPMLAVNKYLILCLFITIWVNDSLAYCVGSLTAKLPNGNHKMFPRISPAKSWEGLFGGFVFAALAGFVFSQLGWIAGVGQAIIVALAIAIAGTFGDLMESQFKRTIGVKDSGRFLPGHGGVLDRFDSILLATPVVYCILTFLLASC